MNKDLKHIKLSDKDKKIITKNMDICTDLHGKGCEGMNNNESNKKLN
jgi:hypothetical protein